MASRCCSHLVCSNSIYRVFFRRTIIGLLLLALAVFLTVIDPLYWGTRYMLKVTEGSSVYQSLQNPDYLVHEKVYIFNYTNADRFMEGLDDKLKIEEVGPFVFQEKTEGLNMSLDMDENTLRITPYASLVFLPELSVGRMEDIEVVSPNLVMIVLGTLGADVLPSFSNSLVTFIMRSVNSQPFMRISAQKLLMGYKDPLVDLAYSYFPGWIDFDIVGILRMFYTSRPRELQLDLNPDKQFSIKSMEGSEGLKEQCYSGPETETQCNTIRGTYPGMLITPNYPKDQLMGLFRFQGCRVYPFSFEKEGFTDYDVPYYRFSIHKDAYNNTSEFACSCGTVRPPDGLLDISRCYYNFPAYISPPHFYNSDSSLLNHFEGLSPERDRASVFVEFDPVTGVPLHIRTTSQTNLRINASPYNPLMKRYRDVKYLPVMWLSMETPFGASEKAVFKLRLLHVHVKRIIIALQVILPIAGLTLIALSFLSFVKGVMAKRKLEIRIDQETAMGLICQKFKAEKLSKCK